MAGGVDGLTTPDGLELALYRWPLDAPRALCLLIHGYAEHLGRYQALAEALNGAGFEVWGIDLRGHGRSPGPRADVRRFADYVADVSSLSEQVERQRPGLPVVAMGHSMGGAIALRFALEQRDRIQALVLSSPFLRPAAPPPSWLRGLASGLAALLPQLPLQPLDTAALSRDASVVAAYRADPLTYSGWVKARMGNELLRAGPPLLSHAPALQLPLLLLHGGADRLADPQASRELAAVIGPQRCSLRIYPDGYHELFNDLDRQAVLADLLAWLDEQLPGGGPGAAAGR